MRNFKAHTFIELLVGFVISAVLIFMIGSIVGIGNTSYTKVRKESQIFSDLAYSLKFMRNRSRPAESFYRQSTVAAQWKGDSLIVRNFGGPQSLFGVLISAQEEAFVYLPDKDNVNARDTLFRVPAGDGNDLSFQFDQQPEYIHAYLFGTKEEIPFNLSTYIVKRIQRHNPSSGPSDSSSPDPSDTPSPDVSDSPTSTPSDTPSSDPSDTSTPTPEPDPSDTPSPIALLFDERGFGEEKSTVFNGYKL